MSFKEKYYKYKNKYLNLKNLIVGGGNKEQENIEIIINYLKDLPCPEEFVVDENNYIAYIRVETDETDQTDQTKLQKVLTIYKDVKVSLKNPDSIAIIKNIYDYNNAIHEKTLTQTNRISIYNYIDNGWTFYEGGESNKTKKDDCTDMPEDWLKIINFLTKICKLKSILNKTEDETKDEDIFKVLSIPKLTKEDNEQEIHIHDYNDLMTYLSSLNIHEDINDDDIDNDLFNFFKKKLDLSFITSQKSYINCLNAATDQHSAWHNNDKIFRVSTNGAMAVITKSVLKLNNPKLLLFPLDIITLFKLGVDNELICSYHNGYTAQVNNYAKKQELVLNNKQEDKLEFKTNGKNQNFLQWFIMSINPLTFFVPSNAVDDSKVLEKKDILSNIKKCIIFYSVLNFFIKPKTRKVNYMKSILFQEYDDKKIDFNEYIETIKIEQKNCTFSKFPVSDGFDGSSTPEDMLTMNFLNEYYGHKYLDPRHLITILLGSQKNPEYRESLREKIPDLLLNLKKLKSTDLKLYNLYKLQYFSRLKLARFEPVKLDDCINYIDK